MEEKELEKEEKKEPIKPLILVPQVDKEGHTVFVCTNSDDADLVKTGVSNPKGVKIKSAKENTCPLEPDKPYDKSICKVINELFKKRKKGKEKSRKNESQ